MSLNSYEVLSDRNKGLVLAVSSSVFIGASFIVKKKGLREAGRTGIRAGKYVYSLQQLPAGGADRALTPYLVSRQWRILISLQAIMVGWHADHGGWRSGKFCSLRVCTSHTCDSTGCSQHHCQVEP